MGEDLPVTLQVQPLLPFSCTEKALKTSDRASLTCGRFGERLFAVVLSTVVPNCPTSKTSRRHMDVCSDRTENKGHARKTELSQSAARRHRCFVRDSVYG